MVRIDAGARPMTDQPPPDRRRESEPPIDEGAFGGSAAENGGLYDDEGATVADTRGDPMSIDEEGRQPRDADEAGAGETPESDQ
jgi:hypothetical protein